MNFRIQKAEDRRQNFLLSNCKISLHQCKNFLHFFILLFLNIVDNQVFMSLA